MIVIFIASSIPDVGSLPGGVSDKSAHAIGYGILGALILRALAHGRFAAVRWSTAAGSVLLATLYGATDEFHQSFVPGRSPDVHDVLADATGAAIAALVLGVIAWGILKTRRQSS
jgi:VanZ family protein